MAPKKSIDANEEFLNWALAAYSKAVDRWTPQWQQMREDFNFLGREHWPTNVIQARGADKPCPVFDITGPMVRKVANEARQSPPGIIIRRLDDAEDAKVAEILQGRVRAIEEESKAPEAYETALYHTAGVGLGYIFYNIKDSDESFEEVITVERVEDPTLIALDPDSTNEHDAQWCIWPRGYSEDRVRNDYGDDAVPMAGITPNIYLDQWKKGDKIFVAEVWKLDKTPDTLLQLKDLNTEELKTCWQSEMEANPQAFDGYVVLKKKTGHRPVCKYAIITGCKVIHLGEWPGKYIPVVPVFGNSDWVSTGKMYSGITRSMIDPNRTFNYLKAVEVETVALAPRAPYIVYEGQISQQYAADWHSANVNPKAYLTAKAFTPDGQAYPEIKRQGLGIDTQAILAGQEALLQLVGRITGVTDAAVGEQTNDISGKAITARIKISDSLNMQFMSNLHRSVEHGGRILVDLIRSSYKDGRKIRYISPDGKEHTAVVGNRTIKNPETDQVDVFDITAGSYAVSIDAGPSYPTKRAEAASAMSEMMQFIPDDQKHNIMDIMASYQDWPNVDVLVKRLEKLVDPGLREVEGQSKADPEAEAMLQQYSQELDAATQQGQILMQEIQQLQQTVQQQQTALIANKEAAEAQIQVATIKAAADLEKERIKAGAALEKTDIEIQAEAIMRRSEQEARRLDTITQGAIQTGHKVLDIKHKLQSQRSDQEHQAITNAFERQHKEDQKNKQPLS